VWSYMKEKSSGSKSRKPRSAALTTRHPSIRKSPTSGDRSVGIVRPRIKPVSQFVCFFLSVNAAVTIVTETAWHDDKNRRNHGPTGLVDEDI
jgi:hypothetical protein